MRCAAWHNVQCSLCMWHGICQIPAACDAALKCVKCASWFQNAQEAHHAMHALSLHRLSPVVRACMCSDREEPWCARASLAACMHALHALQLLALFSHCQHYARSWVSCTSGRWAEQRVACGRPTAAAHPAWARCFMVLHVEILWFSFEIGVPNLLIQPIKVGGGNDSVGSPNDGS